MTKPIELLKVVVMSFTSVYKGLLGIINLFLLWNVTNLFALYRENEEQFTTPKAFPNGERVQSPKSFLEARAGSSTPPVIIDVPNELKDRVCDVEYMPDLEERPCSVMSEETERKLVDEEIAAVLSGESEILKEHNTIGFVYIIHVLLISLNFYYYIRVNFYRIFPKPGVCMSSDVLRSLNEEATKTKAEKEKENRKWTTFLQKPDRPIPKSKQQIEAERRAANAYKVTIVRGSSRSVSPAPRVRKLFTIILNK